MPRNGKSVARFDIIRDIESGKRYKVIYIARQEPETYYLSTVDNGGATVALSDRELRARFELDRPADTPRP